MVTKCSGALTDGAKTLYPPLYLREPGSDITVIYDVYVTVINEKRSEKPREGFFTLSVYQSTNSGKITPVGLFALFFVFFPSNLNSYVNITWWQNTELQPLHCK